jgi:hypothetical protein
MCRVLYADLLNGAYRRELFADPAMAWAWRDAQFMEFAKGRVVKTAARLMEEDLGPLEDDKYDYTVSVPAVLASSRWESNHRSDTPVCLMNHLLEHGKPYTEHARYRTMLVGNVAQFQATMGDYDDARRTLARLTDVPDAPPPHPDYAWAYPSSRDLLQAIEQVADRPQTGSTWLGNAVNEHHEPSAWAVLDTLAQARREAQARQEPSPNRDAAVHRLRDAFLDRSVCVPMHMLGAYDLQ